MSRRERNPRLSLLVRNLPLDARADDVRYKFERYGTIRDIYLPKDHNSGRPRGFGFVEFMDERDAEDAMYGLDGKLFGGREISVVMSKDSRKTPNEMYRREGDGGRSSGRDDDRRERRRSRSRDRRRSYSPDRHHSSQRSPEPAKEEREGYREERQRSPGPDLAPEQPASPRNGDGS